MITTLKITLINGRFCNGEWSANIEIDDSSTLEELHFAIQKAVQFNNDHLYCFYVSRTERMGSADCFDDENELIFSTTIASMFPLPAKKSLYYMFDWGDSWIFKVSRTRKALQEPKPGVTYPRVTETVGKRPVQYLREG